MATRPPVLIATSILAPEMVARLRQRFDAPPPPPAPPDIAWVVAQAGLHQAQGILIGSQTRIDASTIAALPRSLRILATVSVGTDHIDLDAAAARGLVVTNTPGVLDACNADLTWLLILGAARRATEAMDYVRRGRALCPLVGTRVNGRTLGIWGMGRIGREVARRAAGFDMRVIYHNRRRLPPGEAHGAEFIGDRDTFLARAEILTLHMPHTPATEGIVDAGVLARLPRGAIFVNAARGGLVDEEALFASLASGHLAGAGLDVYRNEPDIDPRFGSTAQIFALPHIGSATADTRAAMAGLAIDNLEAVLTGGAALTAVITGGVGGVA